jgi:hypothetical protein
VPQPSDVVFLESVDVGPEDTDDEDIGKPSDHGLASWHRIVHLFGDETDECLKRGSTFARRGR